MDNDSNTVSLTNNKWVLWYHLNNDTNWNLDSYTPLATITTNEKLSVILDDYINEDNVVKSTLFFMKNDINPTWEDKNNINGGAFSLKVPNKLIYDTWKTILYKTIQGELLTDTSLTNDVTGISLSPKKYYCIIKVWVSNCDNTDVELLNLNDTKIQHDVCLFRKHVSC